LQIGVMQVPPQGPRGGQGIEMLLEFQTDDLGAPGGVIASGLTDVLDERGSRLLVLLLSALGIVRFDGSGAAELETSEQALDGSQGDGEASDDVVGISLLLPELKKAGCEEGRVRRAA
jgi:hypothetical protein